jgi:hypothetical protein
MKYQSFWTWFIDREEVLRNSPPEEAAGSIARELRTLESRVGVEIADTTQYREVIVTSNRESDLFPVIRGIISESPRLANWRFIALKPPLGFDFCIDSEGLTIDPHKLLFEPLRSDNCSNVLGIRVFVPAEYLGRPGLEQLIWRTIETGVGEEAAAGISCLELKPFPTDREEMIPLDQLNGFLTWRSAHTQNSKRGDSQRPRV